VVVRRVCTAPGGGGVESPSMAFDRIRLVSLDVGGTLLHAYPSVGEVYASILADHGAVVAPESIESRFRRVFTGSRLGPRPEVSDELERAYWREVVGEVVGPFRGSADIDAVFADLYDAFASAERWRIDPDAVTTLGALKHSGYRLVILSNADSRLRGILEELGLDDLVEAVFISAELGFEKPDLRIFRHVEEVVGTEPRAILHVGDSRHHDGLGASRAGWEHLILDGRLDPDARTIRRLGDLCGLLTDPVDDP
jgi:REG-2-like HAD superfamily hydrolase